MTAVYIILGILGYILVASLIHLFYRLFLNLNDIFLAVVWPITFPGLFIYSLFILFAFAIKWTSNKIEQLYKKHFDCPNRLWK
jgi:hypothetical protein